MLLALPPSGGRVGRGTFQGLYPRCPRQLSLVWPRALGMNRRDTIHPIGGTVRTLLRRHEDVLFLLLTLLPKCRFVLLGDCLASLWPTLQTAPADPCSPTQTDPGPELSWLRFGELGSRGGGGCREWSSRPAQFSGLPRSPFPFADGLQRPPEWCPAAELLRPHILQRGAQRCVFTPPSHMPFGATLASLYLGPPCPHPGR